MNGALQPTHAENITSKAAGTCGTGDASMTLAIRENHYHPSPLAIPELLEHILSCLPPAEIWTARNVCQDWRAAIATSPTLQRLLGFTSKYHPYFPQYCSDNPFRINPVLEHLNLAHQTVRLTAGWCLGKLNFPAQWRTKDTPWRGLQLCEPPAGRLFFKSPWLHKYVEREAGENGITIGQLVDMVGYSRVGTLYIVHGW